MRILIVEDEQKLADALAQILKSNKYMVDTVYDGSDGLDYGLSDIYDLIILDIMLPIYNGLEVLKQLRAKHISTPVLLLTAKSQIEDKIWGLDAGADDYLTKPFDTGELLARVRAMMRRKGEVVSNQLEFSDLVLNKDSNKLICKNQEITLGLKELLLLELLMINSNQVVTKECILTKIWGYDDQSEYNNVEVYVSFLRKKLTLLSSAAIIRTVRGIGYSLEEHT